MTKPSTPAITSWTWASQTRLATVNVEGDEDSEIKVFWEDNSFQTACGFLGSRTGSGQIIAELNHNNHLGNFEFAGPISLFAQAVNQSGEYSDLATPVYSIIRNLFSDLYAEDIHREGDELHFRIAGIQDHNQVMAFAVAQGSLRITIHSGDGEQAISGLNPDLGYIFICFVFDEMHRRIDGIFIMNAPSFSIQDRKAPVICPRINNNV
jgi:hypothetical protein